MKKLALCMIVFAFASMNCQGIVDPSSTSSDQNSVMLETYYPWGTVYGPNIPDPAWGTEGAWTTFTFTASDMPQVTGILSITIEPKDGNPSDISVRVFHNLSGFFPYDFESDQDWYFPAGSFSASQLTFRKGLQMPSYPNNPSNAKGTWTVILSDEKPDCTWEEGPCDPKVTAKVSTIDLYFSQGPSIWDPRWYTEGSRTFVELQSSDTDTNVPVKFFSTLVPVNGDPAEITVTLFKNLQGEYPFAYTYDQMWTWPAGTFSFDNLSLDAFLDPAPANTSGTWTIVYEDWTLTCPEPFSNPDEESCAIETALVESVVLFKNYSGKDSVLDAKYFPNISYPWPVEINGWWRNWTKLQIPECMKANDGIEFSGLLEHSDPASLEVWLVRQKNNDEAYPPGFYGDLAQGDFVWHAKLSESPTNQDLTFLLCNKTSSDPIGCRANIDVPHVVFTPKVLEIEQPVQDPFHPPTTEIFTEAEGNWWLVVSGYSSSGSGRFDGWSLNLSGAEKKCQVFLPWVTK